MSTPRQWELPASKSISNRLLILRYLYKNISIQNLSTADDTLLLNNILSNLEKTNTINCKNAGTVARFLAVLLASRSGHFILTGNDRMKQRPIAELVEKLILMGADIHYLNTNGYLPIEINGTQLSGGEISLSGNTTSQFASALLLVAPTMKNNLVLNFEKEPVSKPYISMTCEVMRRCGFSVFVQNKKICVETKKLIKPITFYVENDWSSASYAYNCVALSTNAEIFLNGLEPNSLQGDSILAEWYRPLGVETKFCNNGILLSHYNYLKPNLLYNCMNNPDLVPAIAIACAALGLEAEFQNLQTLNFKECNRLDALAIELKKLNCNIEKINNTLKIFKSQLIVNEPIKTYADHRLAMAFATLACRFNNVDIENPEVVKKSFPNFWTVFLNNE